MKIFITILLIVSYFKTHAQSISCLAWEYNVSQEIYNENDSSASSILDMMLTQLKTENKIYLKGDTMVFVEKYDSKNQVRSVYLFGENYYHSFITLAGVTKYFKEEIDDLNADLLKNKTFKPKIEFIKNSKIGPFNCKVHEINNPELDVKITITTTNEIDLKYNYLNLPYEDKVTGFALEFEMDFGFSKIITHSENFKYIKSDPLLFSLSSEKMEVTDISYRIKFTEFVNGYKSQKEVTSLVDGEYSDIFKKMNDDGVIKVFHIDNLELNPSFDKPELISYFKNSNFTIEELNSLFLKYDLISKEDLHIIIKSLDINPIEMSSSTYIDIIHYTTMKNLLNKRKYKSILIENIRKNNINPKDKNHPEANSFLNNEIDLKSFLASYKGIYDFQILDTLESPLLFKQQLISILKTLFPKINIMIDSNNEGIELNIDNTKIVYSIKTDNFIVDVEYDDNGNIINKSATNYDFSFYYKNEMLSLLRQIGADFDLNLVFDFKDSWSVFPYIFLDKRYEQLALFSGELLLCIEKKSSTSTIFKKIPFTKIDYDIERDYLSSFRYFYESNPEVRYVPLYKKEKLYEMIKNTPYLLKLDSSFNAEIWLKQVKNRLFQNLDELFQTLPEFGVRFHEGTRGFNSNGLTFESIFPTIFKLLNNEFNPSNFEISNSENGGFNLTFNAYNTKYKLSSSAYNMEIDFLRLAIKLLKQNNQYNLKKVYLSSNFGFFISKDLYKLLNDEFELDLMLF